MIISVRDWFVLTEADCAVCEVWAEVKEQVDLYYIKNQQGATFAVLFIRHCKITLHVLDAFCVHHQEY